jgi:hypothetical protein
MKHLAWAVLSLGLAGWLSIPAHAQDAGREDRPVVQLDQNYPNPFNPETTIPFTLSRDLWESGARPVVSLRIYNVLAQLVAIPVLSGSGEPLEGTEIDWNGSGSYEAYWDGKVRGTDREAASGVYVYQISVNGHTATRRMTIIK